MQGRRRHVALSHARDVGIAGGPVFAFVDALPLRGRDQPAALVGQFDAGRLVIADGARIFTQTFDAQTLNDLIFIASAQFIETHITRVGNAVQEVNCAKSFRVDHPIQFIGPIPEWTFAARVVG